jgi:hypothetical protein
MPETHAQARFRSLYLQARAGDASRTKLFDKIGTHESYLGDGRIAHSFAARYLGDGLSASSARFA